MIYIGKLTFYEFIFCSYDIYFCVLQFFLDSFCLLVLVGLPVISGKTGLESPVLAGIRRVKHPGQPRPLRPIKIKRKAGTGRANPVYFLLPVNSR